MAKSLDLLVKLIGQDAGASAMLKGLGGDAKHLGDKFDHSTGKAGVFGKIGKGAMIGVAGAAGAAAAGIGLAVPVLINAGKAAMEDEKSQQLLAGALENAAGARKGDIAAAEAWIGKQGEALGVTDDQLRPALSRLARSTKDVGEAQDLASLAMDVSAGSGNSLESVAGALAKAHDGNVGALARLGIQTKDASGKTLEFDQIVKNAAATFGGQAADSAGTLEGKMGRLRLMFDEAKEAVGARLLPVFTTLIGWVFDKAIPAFREWGERIMPKLREMWDGVTKAFEGARPGLQTLWDAFKGFAGFIADKVVPIWLTLQGTILKGVIGALGKLGEALPGIGAAILGFTSAAVAAFGGLWDIILAGVENILKAAAKIPGPWQDNMKAAASAVEGFRDRQKTAIDGAVQSIDGAKRSLENYATEAAKDNKTAKMKADIADLQAKIGTAKQELGDPDLTKDRKAQLKADIAQLQDKVNDAKGKLGELHDRTVDVSVRLNFTKRGDYYIRTGVGGKLLELADGGVVKARPGGTLAVIGEGGYDEAVVPLKPGTGMAAASAGDTYNITIEGGLDSSEAIARRVQTVLLDLKRRQGVALGLA